MELYQGILAYVLSRCEVKVTFENLQTEDPGQIVEQVSYKALMEIRDILNNPELSDFDCIERIVSLLRDIGSDGGSRHDF